MLFNSYEFIFVFLPITFFVYFYLNNKRLVTAGKGFLVFSSLFFYSWWNVLYLPIILGSMLFNFVIGSSLNKRSSFSKKSLLIFGVVANIALLGYFKYTDFLIDNFNFAFNSNIELLHLALPLAISFFTFQQIAYLVDSYKEETKEYDFLNYAVFVSFFPQLIAGPILHHREMMPQFENIRSKVVNYRNISMGLFVFSIGLFKKVVIADTFAIWAISGFDTTTSLNLFEAWATSLSYTFQLYFDFSGYTDMAIGLALMFNIRLPINFNSPYKATTIKDFWRRWHITLSRFLRDYIYIPLGGNRGGEIRTYANLMATFVLGGLWHGAGWTFVLWGFLHGAALVIHRTWSRFGIKLWTWLAWFITFNFINISWVFFRAKDLDDAIKVLSGMAGLSGVVYSGTVSSKLSILGNITVDKSDSINLISYLAASILFVLVFKNTNQLLKKFTFSKISLIFSVLIFVVAILKFNEYSEFLYFRF